MKSLHVLYHELRPERSRYSYVTPCAEFEAHCAFFAGIRQERQAEALLPEITFDDGHASDRLYALPILSRFGLRARFFITAGWTGERAGYMSWSQLRDLQAAGHEIGAHGFTHALLTTCSASALKLELSDARRRLEDGLGAKVTTMSLPGGRANRRVLQACEDAGFLQIFTSVPRAEDMEMHPRMVGRLNLHGGTSVEWLESVLRPASGVLARLHTAQKVKAVAQGLLGDRVYAALWALGNRQEPEPVDAGFTAS